MVVGLTPRDKDLYSQILVREATPLPIDFVATGRIGEIKIDEREVCGRLAAPLSQRIADLRPVVGPHDIISTFETRIKAKYTLDTLRALKARYPGVHFVWIMGGDSLAGFHKWRGWVQIMHMVPVVVVSRPGALMNARFSPAAKRFSHFRVRERSGHIIPGMKAPAWAYLKGPLHGHSSTAIRAQRIRSS